jgi:hypothetical protein
MLGVIIDARPRPLTLPDSPTARAALLWEWLAALGVPQPQSPAKPAPEEAAAPAAPVTISPSIEPTAEPPVDEPASAVAPAQTPQAAPFLEALPPLEPRQSPQPTAQTQAPGVQDDLDAIRRELIEPAEQPKRGGLFRRRS